MAETRLVPADDQERTLPARRSAMRFTLSRIFVVCLLFLVVLLAITKVLDWTIPVWDEVVWPGALITVMVFVIFKVDLFGHPHWSTAFDLVFNAAIYAAGVFALLRLINLLRPFGRKRT